MLASGFEFITDQSQPQKPGAEGIFLVLRLGFNTGRTSLYKRLMGNGKAQLKMNFLMILAPASAVVPHFFHFIHGSWTLVIEFLQKAGVCFLTIPFPIYLHL